MSSLSNNNNNNNNSNKKNNNNEPNPTRWEKCKEAIRARHNHLLMIVWIAVMFTTLYYSNILLFLPTLLTGWLLPISSKQRITFIRLLSLTWTTETEFEYLKSVQNGWEESYGTQRIPSRIGFTKKSHKYFWWWSWTSNELDEPIKNAGEFKMFASQFYWMPKLFNPSGLSCWTRECCRHAITDSCSSLKEKVHYRSISALILLETMDWFMNELLLLPPTTSGSRQAISKRINYLNRCIIILNEFSAIDESAIEVGRNIMHRVNDLYLLLTREYSQAANSRFIDSAKASRDAFKDVILCAGWLLRALGKKDGKPLHSILGTWRQ
jgi:hypothetical protein